MADVGVVHFLAEAQNSGERVRRMSWQLVSRNPPATYRGGSSFPCATMTVHSQSATLWGTYAPTASGGLLSADTTPTVHIHNTIFEVLPELGACR